MKTIFMGRYALVDNNDPNIPTLRRVATFTNGQGEQITAYRKTAKSLAFPKYLLTEETWSSLGYSITRDSDPLPTAEYRSSITLRDYQLPAFERVLAAGDGVLSLRCGGGKTVVALHLIATLGLRALIVVPTVLLEEQWAAAAETFLGVRSESLREVKAPTSPIVTTTVHTMRSIAHRVRPGYWDAYSMVVFDEAHHMGAPTFHEVAGLIKGRRLGLTATPYRGDGMEGLYLSHLGPLLYSDTEMTTKPEVRFIRTGIFLDAGVTDTFRILGRINKPLLLNHLLLREDRVELTARLVRWATENRGRTLVVCELIAQAHRLADHLGLKRGEVVLTSETSRNDRVAMLKRSGLLIATSGIVKEGFDADDLDTLVVTVPQSSATFVVQVIGRVMREKQEKKVPIVAVLEDTLIPTTHRWADAFRRTLKEHGIPQKTLNEEEFYDEYTR